jgi:hypothetical protein
MSEMDVIRHIAERTMKVPTPPGVIDNWLWDRTMRILRNVEHICRMPELTDRNIPIDRFCLVAATYFADTGLTRYAQADGVFARPGLSDVNPIDLRDFSTQIVAEHLSEILPGPKIEKCSKIIIESANRFTELTEAIILSDARNLEDMGVVGLVHEFRRAALAGKGVSETLDSWRRKIDYRYWQARLKEGFRFESARRLAEQRFHTAEYIMNQLYIEHSARDVEELLQESLDKTATTT